MSQLSDALLQDIEKIKRIQIVPSLLEVVCQTTGMGFAAIARVTTDKWIACGVRDEINFGLVPGSELVLKTTICDEIRDNRQMVVIDHVAADEQFRHHHTPAMYGFQSYISVPIILKTGEFFGTLCAIDPQPAALNNPKIIGLFTLFAELISFHLQSVTIIEESSQALHQMSTQLHHSTDENRQYRFISHHNLQEPLRKINLFSSMLLSAADNKDMARSQDLAMKIDTNARKISMMIKDLSDFSGLEDVRESLERVDIRKVIADVQSQLYQELNATNTIVNVGALPVIDAVPVQMEQLFYNLFHNALRFTKPDADTVITISSQKASKSQDPNEVELVSISFEDNGRGIEKDHLERIFDIFSPFNPARDAKSTITGLAYCRKIIRNHGGTITVTSEPGHGTTVFMTLPVT